MKIKQELMDVHKARKAFLGRGYGIMEYGNTPLCGCAEMYCDENYKTSRFWAKVTCKKCLAKKPLDK